MSAADDIHKMEPSNTSDQKAEHRRQVESIKRGARFSAGGRGYLLPGLWACRLAAGLTQRQLAESMGSDQATVRKLEREDRGAYMKTIRRLCEALGVTPGDLLCKDAAEHGTTMPKAQHEPSEIREGGGKCPKS